MSAATGKLLCSSCLHVFGEDEAGPPVYECNACGQSQAGEDSDARRCQECNKFCAKLADRSCPECEAPDEDLRPATTEDVQRFEAEQERAKRPPSAEEVAEREARIEEHRKHTEERTSRWEGPDSLARAFEGLFADYGDTLDVKASKILGSFAQSLSLSLEHEEVAAIAERILALQEFRAEVDAALHERSPDPDTITDQIASALAKLNMGGKA